MQQSKQNLIKLLTETEALMFGDFTTKSGRKTNYFVNMGKFKSGSAIKKLGSLYAAYIYENLKDEIDVLFGPAYKGIPLVVAVATALYNDYDINIEFCFNRKEIKDHGEGGSFVGANLQDKRVLIIEDVITAGTAVREVLPMIKSAENVQVNHMLVAVNRMEKGTGEKLAADELYEDFGVKVHSLINSQELLENR